MATISPPVLKQELDYFEKHRVELLEQAPGKYALVKGDKVIGIFDTELDEIRAGYQKIGNEPFLVKHIVDAEVPLTFTSFNLGI